MDDLVKETNEKSAPSSFSQVGRGLCEVYSVELLKIAGWMLWSKGCLSKWCQPR